MELGHWDTGDQQQEVITEEGLWAELYRPSREENASPKIALYLPFFLFLCFFFNTLLCFLLLHNKSP